ncbi:MAG: acetyl-CoA carboxylase biotin carboxyl carrier protein [Candidatus Binatia bacterium]
MEGEVTELTEEEVLQILNLIEKSTFDFLELQVGDLKLTVSKGGYRGSVADKSALEASADPATAIEPATKAGGAEAGTRVEQPEAKPIDAALREGTVPITAPMVGTFYTTPQPGSPPFVELGGHVDEDATVGLIEVMKVFNAVKSGVRGVIAEICVETGQFVEYGQTLFLVRPEGGSDEKGLSG